MEKILWFILGGVLLFGFFKLIYKGWTEKAIEPQNGTIFMYPEEDDEIDEYSPHSLDFDKTLNDVILRRKLSDIEDNHDVGGCIGFMTVQNYLELRNQKELKL
jgi:hypothetical protein